MPRGFLVKRTRKAGPVSYRIRGDEDPRPPAGFASVITSTWVQERTAPAPPAAARGSFQHQGSLDRAPKCSSPAGAQAFPGPPLLSLAQVQASPASLCGQPQAKKARSSGGGGGRDDVTTSPVLGLRIKEDPRDSQPRGRSASPLGEFICQLCREHYADPLALAQHRCSRIVRVEYRCVECPKAFSCPANLASHRRWHKPRSPPEPPAKENQIPGPALAAPSPPPSEESHPCAHCAKTFRRAAYLRKHLALHRPAVVLAESNSRQPPPALPAGATAPSPAQEGPFSRYLRPAGHENTGNQIPDS